MPDYLHEISVNQLAAIVNWFAKSPNIRGIEIDDIETNSHGHLDRLFVTVNYLDKAQVPVVLDAGDEFPLIVGETREN